MYSLETADEAEAGVSALPAEALAAYAELTALLEIAPWSGPSVSEERPDGAVRSHAFGAPARGLAYYLILEDQRRVVVLRVIWTG